jgi:hypothetical protein
MKVALEESVQDESLPTFSMKVTFKETLQPIAY